MSASTPSSPAAAWRFGRYELRPGERVLLADGVPARLGGRAFDMLLALAERHDRVVAKRELMDLGSLSIAKQGGHLKGAQSHH